MRRTVGCSLLLDPEDIVQQNENHYKNNCLYNNLLLQVKSIGDCTSLKYQRIGKSVR